MPDLPLDPLSASRRKRPQLRPLVSARDTIQPSDSVPITTAHFASLPMDFGRYRIESLLGQGMMGTVYRAHDRQLDRVVALKLARSSASGAAKIIQRMEVEAKAAAKVDHPQICKVYDYGEIDGIHFIALQYIDGEDLKTYLKRVGRRRSPKEALEIVLKTANALNAAHQNGVIHRDLKPENIMVNLQGDPVIMDFGLARRLTQSTNAGLTQGMIIGTAGYMSPEQAIGKPEGIDHRTDIYALGVILFEMLTGQWPFQGSAIEVMGKKCVLMPPSPRDLVPDLPPQLVNACEKMIAKDKEDRFIDVAELIASLQSIDLSPRDVDAVENRPFAEWEPEEIALTANSQGGGGLSQRTASKTLSGSNSLSRQSNSFEQTLQLLCGQVWRNRLALLALVAAGAMLLGMTFFFRTGDALFRMEVLADDIDVTFHEKSLNFADGQREFKVTPGEQILHIKSGDLEFDTDKFSLKRGENPVVTIERVQSEIVAKLGDIEISRRSNIPRPSFGSQSSETGESLRRDSLTPAESGGEKNLVANDSSNPAQIASEPYADRRAYTFGEGQWSVVGDELVQSQVIRQPSILVFGDPNWSEYNYSFEAKTTAGTHGVKAVFHHVRDGDAYMFAVGNYFNQFHDVSKTVRNVWSRPAGMIKSGRFDQSRWYSFRLEVRGTKVTCFLDNIQQFVLVDDAFSRGRCGVSTWESAAQFRNLLVSRPDGTIVWRGLPNLPARDQDHAEKEAEKNADSAQPDGEAGIETLRKTLVGHNWHYYDNLFPPGDQCQFRENGTWHRWNWNYWVVSPSEIRIQYDRNNKNPDTGLLFTFNKDLTEFTGEYKDPRGKTHIITGTRQ